MNLLEELEALRQRAWKTHVTALILMGAGLLLFLIFWPLGIPIFVAGVIAMILSHTKQVHAYTKAYKEKLVVGFLSAKIEDLCFDPAQGIAEKTVKSVKMVDTGNLYESNDLIEGVYHGVRLCQSDLSIQQRTGSGKNSTTRTYFRGRWLILEFDNSFAADLQVRDRTFRNTLKPGGRGSKSGKMTEIETDSQQFNEVFKVYAKDENAALAILTPQLMEALLQARTQAGGQVLFGFVGNRLHIAVNNQRDSFEPSVWKPIDPSIVGREIVADVKLITDLIDTLCIDNGLFGEGNAE